MEDEEWCAMDDKEIGRRENGEKRNCGERRFLGCQELSKRGKIVMYL